MQHLAGEAPKAKAGECRVPDSAISESNLYVIDFIARPIRQIHISLIYPFLVRYLEYIVQFPRQLRRYHKIYTTHSH